MISNYDVIKTFRKYEAEGKKLSMKLSEDEKSLVDSETGEFITALDAFTVELRRKEHCDFEIIYSEHASLDEVYSCRECGTVIFGGDDEWRYDPSCKCPTCCNDPSVCRNKYWTKEQIVSDPEKQKTIDYLIAMQKEMTEAAKRRKAREGRHDWKIPLSWYHVYLKWIYPYTKECHTDVRKYHFWQKKPKIKGSLLNVRDSVYFNFSNGYFEDPVKMVVTEIKPDEKEQSLIHYSAHSNKYNHTLSFNNRDIRKSVFLTKKEAKKK